MQAVILAGGLGTRLRPITEKIPKPLVSIHNKPFLEYQLNLLKGYGINEFLLLVGYLGQLIESYFKDGSNLSISISYSYETSPLGTAGALKNAEDKIKAEFLLINGDTLFPFNYKDFIAYFYSHKKLGLIAAYTNSDKALKNNIAVDNLDFVTGYNKNNHSGMTHIDAGVSLFSKEVLENIPANQACSMEDSVYSNLIKNRHIMAYVTDNKFYDIGSFAGLKTIEEILS